MYWNRKVAGGRRGDAQREAKERIVEGEDVLSALGDDRTYPTVAAQRIAVADDQPGARSGLRS